ncbi:DNA methyltransferase [Polaromonas sp.]|uniref:DNA methyltransferase n=1 Tax=Polaromonas sp. TaxID=1869339 RepID=UPI0024883CE3|nr:DNA methyltransferase [Polaromonas sp.]MDI1341599.1 class I SAM-dependent DNA methyltransferase [Polaromonas sp.]
MPLSWNEIKSRALTFSRTWSDAANEDSQGKPFWIDFFEIFGITDKRVATFEHAVKKLLGEKARVDGFVDLFWPGMLLVEQKSRGKNLDLALTQALSYFPGIAERDLPQIIIVCDFARFRVHKLATGETIEFALKDLHKHIKLFGFVAGYKVQTIQPQNPVNIKAAERMGRLHDALKASGYTGHPLELLLVRLLFCLFADDTGIFQPAQVFRNFVEERTSADGSDLGSRLAQLFQILNTEESKRSKALDEQVAAFPYVNGKLFEESLPMADFTAAMREALLDACALDWSAISPAIFGSLFQSIMDDKARRNLGAHYTSEENILKLIKPLFLDDLWAEFEKVKSNRNKLFEFHKKLRLLTFFDPACGCGNFLVISYRELRELELEVLRASRDLADAHSKSLFNVNLHQQISIDVDQFHGIEIEEFPAQIAQVAMWLMDHQMNLRVSEEFGLYFARIPLRTTPHIVHDNALRLDWNEVLPAERCSFVLGNPPFLGKKEQSAEQKADVTPIFTPLKGGGVLDFVAAWYVKATHYMKSSMRESGNEPACAFVSTNSITQGEQVGVLWGWLLAQGVHIHFAHRTFKWSNEAKGKAAVHCVIIGFGLQDSPKKIIYEYENIAGMPSIVAALNINPYLVDAASLVLPNRRTPICDVPEISFGSMPNDGGQLLLDASEKDQLLKLEPDAKPWIRPFLGSVEFINNAPRWCLWLKECPPQRLRMLPLVSQRVARVQEIRRKSDRETTNELAATPSLFGEDRQPTVKYLAIPKTSSERRTYVPIALLLPENIASTELFTVADAQIYHFGILISHMHNAWMRYVCGRLKSDFRYSAGIVYNNYPWPTLEADQPPAQEGRARAAIETAAQAVLDTRAHFPDSSLADLYDPLSMPPALVKAHQKLDVAVDAAYALGGGKKTWKNDAERVAYLFELYQKYTSLLPAAGAVSKRRKAKAA